MEGLLTIALSSKFSQTVGDRQQRRHTHTSFANNSLAVTTVSWDHYSLVGFTGRPHSLDLIRRSRSQPHRHVIGKSAPIWFLKVPMTDQSATTPTEQDSLTNLATAEAFQLEFEEDESIYPDVFFKVG